MVRFVNVMNRDTGLASGAASDSPSEPQFDENGVDLTLVRYTLSLTPTERLKAVENFMRAMASVKPVIRAEITDSEAPNGAK